MVSGIAVAIGNDVVTGMSGGSKGSSTTGSGAGAGAGGGAFFFFGTDFLQQAAERAPMRQHPQSVRMVIHFQSAMYEPDDPERLEPELAYEPDFESLSAEFEELWELSNMVADEVPDELSPDLEESQGGKVPT